VSSVDKKLHQKLYDDQQLKLSRLDELRERYYKDGNQNQPLTTENEI